MRMLLSCVPAVSHANRLLPVIRAAVAAGHQVAVAASARVAARVALPGVRHYPAGLPAFPELGITDQARRHEWLYGTVLPELISRFYPDLVREIETLLAA
jgi:UDP:flavonoid glycosyltransferase YjiC (YdhE family)